MGSHKVKRRRKLRKQREEDRRLGRKLGVPLGMDPAPDYEEIKMLLQCRSPLHEGPNSLPVDHFSKRKDSKRGYQYECKDCRAKMNRSRREKVREAIASKEAEGEPSTKKRSKSKNPRRSGKSRIDRLRQIGIQISEGKSVAEGFSGRGLNNAIKMVVDQQLHLYYIRLDEDALSKRRLLSIIEDAVAEVASALTRASSRVRNMRRASTSPDYIDQVNHKSLSRKRALAVLGLTDSASEKEIKDRYKKMARQYHSDHGGDDDLMKEINAAYDVVKEEFRE